MAPGIPPADGSIRACAGGVLPAWALVSAGVVLIVIVMTRGTFVAAGADVSGYVSQSELWATGSLQVGLPLAAELGWPEPEWSLSPLGYRPATVRGYMVPTYPPGLPILMSLADSGWSGGL